MTTSTDVLPVLPAAAGGLASMGLAGWLGTMSSHTAAPTKVTCGSSPAGSPRGINPGLLSPGLTTAWLAQLKAAGQRVATRRRQFAAVLSFYGYAAAEGVPVTDPKPHQVPKLHRDDADTGALDNAQARHRSGVAGRRPAGGWARRVRRTRQGADRCLVVVRVVVGGGGG